MKNEEERKSESGELVAGAEPRAEEGGEAGSFPRDIQADASGRGPPLLRGEEGGGTFDGNLNRSFLTRRLNLGGGENIFVCPEESGGGGVSSGGIVAVGSGGFGEGGGGGRGADRSSPRAGERAGRGGGGGSGSAGVNILVDGGGHGRGRDLSSGGGDAKSARSQGRSFISSTSGSGGASNCRGEGARKTSGGGESYAAASGILAQAASNTNVISSEGSVGVELKSAEEQEGMYKQEGDNNSTVLTEINPTTYTSGLLKSPPEEMEILETDNNGSNMVDLAADEAQGQEERNAGSLSAPPLGYFGLPRAGTGTVAENLPTNNSSNTVLGSGLSPDTSASAAVVLPSGSLELLGSDEGPPLPIGMARTSDDVRSSVGSRQPDGAGKPRVEIDVDDARPPRPPSTMEASFEDVEIPAKYFALSTKDQGAAAGSCPEHADGDNAPTPLNFIEFDDDDGHTDEKKPAAPSNEDEEAGLDGQEVERSDRDSICEPPNEELEDRVLGATRGPADIAHRINNNRQQLGLDDLVQDPPEDDVDAPENDASTPDPERDSVVRVPVAWRVSEPQSNADDTDEERQEAVIIATPLEPPPAWWKQLNTRRLIALVCALLIAGAIALGILFSRDKSSPDTVPEVSVVFASSPPSTSITPTPQPTTAIPTVESTSSPSGSISPSSSPTECARQISSQVQTIDLQVSDPSETPKVAMDRGSMVAIVKDSSNSDTYTRFYSLINDEWILRDTFLEDHDSYPTVALSGKTAFVGFPCTNNLEGAVSVYEQNRFGDWEKANDPFVLDIDVSRDGFGLSIAIDGDLACVTDGVKFHLLRRAGTKWVQFETINIDDVSRSRCSISGDTIAISDDNSDLGYILQLYTFDADLGGVMPLQDPISADVWHMDLSNDHLVFSTRDDDDDDIFIYRQEYEDQPFALHQQIGPSFPRGFSRNIPFAFDEDILVIGGDDRTSIFSEQDGCWEETLLLDRSYSDYQLSGRTLLAANNAGVYSFNIEDCVQPVPTSRPSAAPSSSPSASPSLLPSQLPSSTLSPSWSPSLLPSMPPSSSLSPTETCFFVEIDVLTDLLYEWTWWDISSVTVVDEKHEKNVVYDSSTIEVQMEGKTFGAAHIRESATDTSANGALCDCRIGRGRCDCQGQVCLIEQNDSFFCGDVSYCEDGGGVATIIYNNGEGPLWTPYGPGNITAAFIGRADGKHLLRHGLGKTITVTASSSLQFESEALHSRRVCLPEGDYEFTIYAHSGYGICCLAGDGYYKVTSNGATIKEGGRFGSKESTRFSLPFVPAPAPV